MDDLEEEKPLWNGPVCSMCGGTGQYPYHPDINGVVVTKWGRCAACNGHGREPS